MAVVKILTSLLKEGKNGNGISWSKQNIDDVYDYINNIIDVDGYLPLYSHIEGDNVLSIFEPINIIGKVSICSKSRYFTVEIEDQYATGVNLNEYSIGINAVASVNDGMIVSKFHSAKLTLMRKDQSSFYNKYLNKNIFMFDVESNGLYGKGFAVGAVVVDYNTGKVIHEFGGRVQMDDNILDPWVKEHVIPHVTDLAKYNTIEQLRDDFWQFFTRHKDTCNVWSDIGVPVESNFIRECIEQISPDNVFTGPYPLHEVATFLLANGIDPDINRVEYAGTDITGNAHNPIYDATISAMCIMKAMKS
jgi:hypothetical protein